MKTVKLKKLALARYEDPSPFPVGELSIKIEGLPKYIDAEIRFLALMNDKEIVKISISEKHNTVSITQDLLCAGTLKCLVAVYSKGVKVEQYEIEPLTIIEVGGDFYADPAIAAITNETERLRQANAKLYETVGKLTKQVEMLITFAKTCISEIPYINDVKILEDAIK